LAHLSLLLSADFLLTFCSQCNEKCITTEAGDAWNKFESAKVTQCAMAILTVLALFGDDIRVLFLAKAADDGWSVLTLMILIIFGIEWAGNSTFQRNYFMSLFFFLDLMVRVSLFPWLFHDFSRDFFHGVTFTGDALPDP